jgi:hypothetical protein
MNIEELIERLRDENCTGFNLTIAACGLSPTAKPGSSLKKCLKETLSFVSTVV